MKAEVTASTTFLEIPANETKVAGRRQTKPMPCPSQHQVPIEELMSTSQGRSGNASWVIAPIISNPGMAIHIMQCQRSF